MAESERDPHDTAAQEAADAEQAKAERQKRIVEESDFKFIMGTKQGRRFMWRLLSITGLFQNPYRGGAEFAGFHSGEQNVGQQLLAEIHGLCPERYVDMLKEQQDNERSRNSRS